MKEFAKADDDARVVFITGSGTAFYGSISNEYSNSSR